MGIAGLPDIFPSKTSYSMSVLEYVPVYLDDLLVLPKDLPDNCKLAQWSMKRNVSSAWILFSPLIVQVSPNS